MEILILVLFYYLTQNPNFAESVKPLMSQIKDSEQMLSFLNDLSKFSKAFTAPHSEEKQSPKTDNATEGKKNPQSPTSGIADEFIQTILDSYLKKAD